MTTTHTGFELGHSRRRQGPSSTDMLITVMIIMVFLATWVGAYGISMEKNAVELERQSLNASGCLSLFQETGNPEYAQRAQEALLFNDRPCL